MVFLLVLGEGVERVFLKECEAANLPFHHDLLPRLSREIGMGLRDLVAIMFLTQTIMK